MALSKTARFYRDNPESYKKKLAKANSHPVWGEQTAERKKKRVESARERRKENRKRKRQGKAPLPKTVHYDHKEGKFKNGKDNMAQAEASRKKNSKRNKKMFGKAIMKALTKRG